MVDKVFNKNATGRLRMSKYDQESGKAAYLAEEAEKNIKKRKVETVHPSKVYATQQWIDLHFGGGGDPIIGNLTDKPVVARKKDGSMHILDGHHRFDRAAGANRSVESYIIDVE